MREVHEEPEDLILAYGVLELYCLEESVMKGASRVNKGGKPSCY